MKRGIALAAALFVAVVVVMITITGWTVGRGAAYGALTTGVPLGSITGQHRSDFSLSIDTPAMLGGTQVGPSYVPSDFTLPANSEVTVTVYDFDTAGALPAQFAKATGIQGPMVIQALNPQNPNGNGPTHTATSLNPSTGVAHTFTITSLGLNVPIAPQSKVTFTFHTPAAGTYTYRCMDPCGSGAAGWGGAMATNGYMQGTVTFA